MKEVYRIIHYKALDNNGLIRTSDVDKLGINRCYLGEMVNEGMLVRESQGVYTVPGESPDEYFLIQNRSEMLIYSYGTALFLLGMSDRVPSIIEVTVPQGYNVSRIKKSFPSLKFHYVQSDVLMEGVVTVTTPQGYQVRVYGPERCICDLIKNRHKIDKQLFTQAMREYFAKTYSARKLIKMARTIGVESEVRMYIEVM